MEETQMDETHWRYRKNKDAGIIDRMKQALLDGDKDNLIEFEIDVDGIKARKSVVAEHDALKELSRDEQVVICKAMQIKGYSDLNEEGIVKKILSVFVDEKKKRVGVTTSKTKGLEKLLPVKKKLKKP